jgi:hypothetical protein
VCFVTHFGIINSSIVGFEDVFPAKPAKREFFMYLIVIAWIYVVLMMAVAEATNTTGTVLGGIMTFFLYGVGPAGLLVYLMGTPARNKAIKKRNDEQRAQHVASLAAAETTAADASVLPDAGSHAAGGEGAVSSVDDQPGITPVRKEP